MDTKVLKRTNYRLTYSITTYSYFLTTCTLIICLCSNWAHAQTNTTREIQDNTPTPSPDDCARFCHENCDNIISYTADENRRCKEANRLCTCPDLKDHDREPSKYDCERYCHMKCSSIRNSVNYGFCVKAQPKCSCGLLPPNAIYSIIGCLIFAGISSAFYGIRYLLRRRAAARYSGNVDVAVGAPPTSPYPAAGSGSAFVPPTQYSQTPAQQQQGAYYTYNTPAANESQASAPFLSGISGPK